ncbi:hypothetical protein [Clostridium drakei]|uniref:Uncharacterized protein n=1 Tax=Clostridium drakei TaxID=332101 RepID=A0A2U8DN28_9CLOT|nr:hypothetical protein [Clostridium drakei]AWI04149.1 hypothetical protein B9W14_06445 [Clostridium drakei]
MATIGQQLTTPESGWRRYDDSNSNFKYTLLTKLSAGSLYNGGYTGTGPGSNGGTVSFEFYGTKLRIIGCIYTDRSNRIEISIDGVKEYYSQYGSIIYQSLDYEKINLTNTRHSVVITVINPGSFVFDAIDIDSTGYLVTQVGQQLISPEIGWKRYDNMDNRILYTGTWYIDNNSAFYKGSQKYIFDTISKVTFNFYGTKFRIISSIDSSSGSKIQITIDNDIIETFSESNPKEYKQILVYEKTSLENKQHTVTINNTQSNYLRIDAIDIDDSGDLLGTGIQLTAPETGWRRYDNVDSRFLYNGTWVVHSVGESGGSGVWSSDSTAKISFKFYGTKLRIICWKAMGYGICTIKIDGISYTFDISATTTTYQIVVYENLTLSNEIHQVELTPTPGQINFDAIDIDSTGYLVHPTLNQVSNLLGMAVGDCIPCRYTASTSGQVGYFSELGTCTVDEISVTGTATPDGLFYFVKTAKGTLVADRVLQTNISWDVLNSAKFIEGNILPFQPTDYVDTDMFTTVGYTNGYSSYSKVMKNEMNIKSTDNTRSCMQNWQFSDYTTGIVINKFRISDIGDNLNFLISISHMPEKSYNHFNFRKNSISLDSFNGGNPVYTGSIINKEIVIFTNLLTSKIGLSVDGQLVYVNNLATFPIGFWIAYSLLEFSFSTTSTSYQHIKLDYFYTSKTSENYFLKDFPHMIRSLSGGYAFSDANGNKSLTENSKGAWPVTNEWDKYIVNSDLGGKITSGDDNIWHTILLSSWTKDTPLTATFTSKTGTSGSIDSTRRIVRANVNNSVTWSGVGFGISSQIASTGGFRPVLEFIESDSKQTNLWY